MDTVERFFLRAQYNFSAAMLKLTAVVFFHSFTVLKFETIIMETIGAAADANFIAMFYSAAIAVLGLGCLLFPMSKAFFDDSRVIKYLPAVAVALAAFVCSAGVLFFSPALPLMAVSALFCVLNLGYLLAWQLWSMSVFLNGTNGSGRVVGIGIMAATLALNYSLSRVEPGLTVFLTVSAFMTLSVVITCGLWKNGFPAKPGKHEPAELPKGLLYVLSIILMTVSFGIAYGMFLKRHPAGRPEFMLVYYAAHGVAAFLLGLLRDVRKKAYAYWTPALIIAFALSPICVNLYPAGHILLEIIGWAFGGLFCLLYILPFIDMAPRTDFPELWVACGAMTRYLVSGITIIPTALLIEFVSYEWVSAVNAILAVLLLKTLSMAGKGVSGEYTGYERDFGGTRDEIPEAAPAVQGGGQSGVIDNFVREYELTLAEARALSRILASEEPLKVISGRENVSERTFQRYLSKVYKKTGTKTRAGLVAMYHMKTLDVYTKGRKNTA